MGNLADCPQEYESFTCKRATKKESLKVYVHEGKLDLLHQCIFVAAKYERITSERL